MPDFLHWKPVREWPIWSFAFPANCAYCSKSLGETDVLFCNKCWAEMPRAQKIPGERLPKHVDWLHAGFSFRDGGITREIVHALKFDGHTGVAARMSHMLAGTIPPGFLHSGDVWVPVPLHWLRQGDRSFNQSEVLCRELVELCGGSVAKLLKRVRNTPAQSGQGVKLRAANVKDAFRFSGREVPENVILVDDVVTTGATVSECARILKAQGVKTVRVLSFSHAE